MTFLTTDKRFWDDRAVTLETVSTLNGGTLDVTVYQDVYGDGFPDKQTTKSLSGGTESLSLDPFVRAKDADYWMKFEATGSPTLDRATLISGTSSTIDYTSNQDWRRSASNSGFTSDDLGDHPDGAVFQRGYNYGSITEGLVAYYPFDDDWDSNPVRDKALDNDGTNNGASYVAGQIRSAGDFNGTDDEVLIPSIPINSDITEYTITGLINVNSFDDGLIFNALDTGSSSEVQLSANSTSTGFEIKQTDESVTDHSIVSSSKSTGVCYHVAGVWDGSELRLYVDASIEGSDATPSLAPGIDQNSIGSGAGFAYFDGQIDEVRIYDRALSQPEIERLANLTVPSTVTPSDTL